MTAKLTLEYDGTRFYGWADQPGRRTVQSELARALGVLLRRDVALTVAGRTDRGVHALGQVVSYEGRIPPLRGLNAVLPDDIAVLAAEEMPDGFDARRDARARRYRYRVETRPGGSSAFERGRALWWRHSLDEEALQACAQALVGTHDLTAFTPTQSYHHRFERTIEAASWVRSEEHILEFRIEARSFMRHMNRVLVGTMLEVGGGRRTVGDFVSLLEGAPRALAGDTAPPHGLYLESVRY